MKKKYFLIAFCLFSFSFCFSQANRGRIQIQGTNLEKSESWATDSNITKKEAEKMLDRLWKKLSATQRKSRESAYKDALKFIKRAGDEGYCGFISKSFQDRGRKDGSARIDIEIQKGCAFTKN